MAPSRSRGSDPPLPAIPENAGATSSWNEEEIEDREEQVLFDRDNAAVNDEDDDGDEVEVAGSLGNLDGNIYNAYPDAESLTSSGVASSRPTDPGPIFVQSSLSGDKWELSWPIWHMLPRGERRAIAAKHGYKTIGEFEEYMSLTRAVDESEGRVLASSGIITLPATSEESDERVTGLTDRLASASVSVSDDAVNESRDWHPPIAIVSDREEVDDSSVSSTEDNVSASEPTLPETNEIDHLEIHLESIRLGGLPCQLPDEILHKCFSYLPVDDHAPLALVSPHWSRFARCESLFKALCQRVYLNQSKRKQLHVARFGTYRKMLELRPRVRTGGGVYVLKYQEVRKIQRDMWTDIPLGAVLECVYYRYLYFFEDGRVMYALTHANPAEMIPRFSRMLLHGYGVKDKWGIWGTYQLRKDSLLVKVSHDWHDVCFQLKVISSNKFLCYDNGDRGMYTTLQLEKHMSSAMGDFDEHGSRDLVKYDVPINAYFRFLRDRRI
ncbi:hypothetical protein ACHAW6_000860 [Cyclotella cf. meneghiniana]